VHPWLRPDRGVYLGLLRQSFVLHGIDLIGYCLMSNQIHLIAVPIRPMIRSV
jgi:hypothetical protein